MQNLMIGSSGSGKGYEACVYQILPALKRGRKVITNMPLDLDKWAALDPSFPDLIELRKRPQPIRGRWEPTREEGAYELFSNGETIDPPPGVRPFAGVWDFYTEWRHPETGQGPLFVIDEAQFCIPYGKTDVQVEEWSALHRHFICDVLWMTQSYGKLSQAVRDNVQLVYRLRKKVAWGQPDKYIRKVQDGIRGAVMNEGQRDYESQYFGLWKSHTQGGAAEEFGADDVRPWWKHWTWIGASACAVLAVLILTFASRSKPAVASTGTAASAKPAAKVVQAEPTTEKPEKTKTEKTEKKEEGGAHPYAGRTLHILGTLTSRAGRLYVFSVAQNGQRVHDVTGSELSQLGYLVEQGTDCAARLSHGKWSQWIICDSPTVSVGNVAGVKSAGRPDGEASPALAEPSGVVIQSPPRTS